MTFESDPMTVCAPVKAGDDMPHALRGAWLLPVPSTAGRAHLAWLRPGATTLPDTTSTPDVLAPLQLFAVTTAAERAAWVNAHSADVSDALSQHLTQLWPELQMLPSLAIGDALAAQRPELLAWWLLKIHADSVVNDWHNAASRVALTRGANPGANSPDIVDDDTRNRLALVVRSKCAALKSECEAHKGDVGMMTGVLARMLRSLGDTEAADKVLGVGDPLSPWFSPLRDWPYSLPVSPMRVRVRFARLLAEALLKHERARAAVSRPALVRVVYAGEHLAMLTGEVPLQLPGLDDGTLRDFRGKVRASVTNMDANDVRVAANALGTVAGHRIIRGVVLKAWSQVEEGHHDPRLLYFEGGWAGFADAMGLKSTHHHKAAENVLRLGQAIQWEGRNGHTGGGWWTFKAGRGSRAGPGYVEVVLGTTLLPGYAVELAHSGQSSGREQRRARRLVPELRHEPPLSALGGGLEGHGWTLMRLFVLALSDRAAQLAEGGLAHIAEADWNKMAASAGVPLARLPRVLDSWAAGDDEAPALLHRDGWGFTLADKHELERTFIEETGRRSNKGKADAAKGAEGRRDKRRR